MGCSIGLPRRSLSMKKSKPITLKNIIRVVHLNGHVEDFKYPILVSHLIGTPAKHVLCTRDELLSPTCKPLPPGTILEFGHLYFLLPLSAFRCDASPMDFAKIVNRLSAAAKTTTCYKAGSLSPLPSSVGKRMEEETKMVRMEGLQNYSCRKPSWRPILDTIGEISFTRRSESDLRGKDLDIKKFV